MASFRGRVGLAVDQTLLYLTGGLAIGDVKSNIIGVASSNGPSNYGSLNKVEVGWVAGLGVEHKISQQWSLKGEFLYYDLGTHTSPTSSVSGVTYASEFSHEILVGRVGADFHF